MNFRNSGRNITGNREIRALRFNLWPSKEKRQFSERKEEAERVVV